MRAICASLPNVTFLHRESIVVNGIRLIGMHPSYFPNDERVL